MSADTNDKCPYCNQILSQKPTRKKKCPNCGNPIFVRGGQLLTEEQATIKDWLTRLENLGLTEKVYHSHEDALRKQWGFKPKINDVIWRFLNSRLSIPSDYFTNKIIFLEMARLVLNEGKDPKQYLAEAAKQELLEIKASQVKQVSVYTVNDNFVCSECRKLEKETFTVESALINLPIPKNCTNQDGCRCSYRPIY
jgi:hypothetical protein